MPDSRWRSLLRPTFPLVVVAILLGVLALAMIAQMQHEDSDDYSGVRSDDLVELLKSLDAANERLNTQIAELTATRNGLLNSTQLSERAEQQAKLRAEQLAILAGTSGATGPGIEVVIDDPNKDVDASALLDAVEKLRDAGAEAIAINGVARVVAQTYFLDDDAEIQVGGREIKRPYRIEVIGDASTLSGAVRFPGGLIDGISTRGGTASVTEKDKVTITALADIKTPEYARPTS